MTSQQEGRNPNAAACTVCGRIRSGSDPTAGACLECITRARSLLTGIGMLFEELPRHLGHVRSSTYDAGRRSTNDVTPLPGGDVLVLLGPGSEGLDETADSSKAGDSTSVAFDLGWWEQCWREARGDGRPGPADPFTSRGAVVVRRALRYLDHQATWAAREHPGFPAFIDDMHELHLRLERATGRIRAATKAAASCFTCGGVLVRKVNDRGFEEEHVTCGRCGRQYDPGAYAMALAAKRIEALSGWLTIAAAATASRRPLATLYGWASDGIVASSCRVTDKAMLVWYPDVQARAERAQRRATRRESRSA